MCMHPPVCMRVQCTLIGCTRGIGPCIVCAVQVLTLMQQLDSDGDGTVSKGEFRQALPLLGFDASDVEAIDEVFDELDEDVRADTRSDLPRPCCHHQIGSLPRPSGSVGGGIRHGGCGAPCDTCNNT